jgi:chromosome partitioning protein
MKIITVAQQKGGVGKTTLSLNIASCLKKGGLNVAILDTDIQGSLTETSHTFEGITILPPQELPNFASLPYDFLFIDTPPYLTDLLADLFSISDYVLVPTTLGIYDVLAMKATLRILKEVQKKRPMLKYGVVVNRVRTNTNVLKESLEILEGYNAEILETQINERISYTRSALTNGVFGTSDTKAQQEIFGLTVEIIKQI